MVRQTAVRPWFTGDIASRERRITEIDVAGLDAKIKDREVPDEASKGFPGEVVFIDCKGVKIWLGHIQ